VALAASAAVTHHEYCDRPMRQHLGYVPLQSAALSHICTVYVLGARAVPHWPTVPGGGVAAQAVWHEAVRDWVLQIGLSGVPNAPSYTTVPQHSVPEGHSSVPVLPWQLMAYVPLLQVAAQLDVVKVEELLQQL
jgi:hypothetical protein